ncbi:MAG TPA: SCO family protein [Parasegetibacter sp.]
MNKKLAIYLGFFVLLTAGFFVFIFGGTDRWKPKLPVMNHVKYFSFTSQDGTPVTQDDVLGKVYVVEYFFTTCKGICPKMNTNMKRIYDIYKENSDFAILSHTVDPEGDSVAVLKHYADSIAPGAKNWWFLTGRKDSLYFAARASYLLDDPKNELEAIAEQFIHTQFFALVDKAGRVRGIYDGLKEDEIQKLKKDIASLLNENPPRAATSGNLFNSNPM